MGKFLGIFGKCFLYIGKSICGMRYIMNYNKVCESIESEIKKPVKGDFVICTVTNFANDYSLSRIFTDFINSNVGKVVGIDYMGKELNYFIRYENIPIELRNWFNSNPSEPSSGFRRFEDNILYFSSDREDCEIFLATNKYNL